MKKSVHFSPLGLIPAVRFISQGELRKRKIRHADPSKAAPTFRVNARAAALHPAFQEMEITDITPCAGGKCYTLRRTDGEPAAYFRAGQYIYTRYEIDGTKTARAYSLSSSPKEALSGIYRLTVCEPPGAFTAHWNMEHWNRGTKVSLSAPMGQFYYDPVRDEKNVIGVSGGSSITAFLSMARAIADGTEDFRLTILYGIPTRERVIHREDLAEITAATDKVRVIYVYSDEEVPGAEHGFISSELVEKYAEDFGDGPYSVFVCGPEPMQRYFEGEREKLGLDRKHVRYDMLCLLRQDRETADRPCYTLTVHQGPETVEIPMRSDEPVLVAMERCGIAVPSACRKGICGMCRSKLMSGEIAIAAETDERRYADTLHGEIHPCITYPLSDLELSVPELLTF